MDGRPYRALITRLADWPGPAPAVPSAAARLGLEGDFAVLGCVEAGLLLVRADTETHR